MLRTDSAILPAATSATLIRSSTARRPARTATHTSSSRSAEPSYMSVSGRRPRTSASGPSTARITSAIWIFEAGRSGRWKFADVLLVAERRGRLSEAQASRFLELLAQLLINVDSSPTDVAGIVATGRRHTLSSYDAAYLLLAERLGAALATLDKPLAKAARKAGVHLLVKP
jgi:predicted nucleic acid-binding protein